jgi:hypothetical protein
METTTIEKELQWARDNHATVNQMLNEGRSHAEIIAALARQQIGLFHRIAELEAIAPSKIVMPDGRVMIRHCPDDLVPVTQIL